MAHDYNGTILGNFRYIWVFFAKCNQSGLEMCHTPWVIPVLTATDLSIKLQFMATILTLFAYNSLIASFRYLEQLPVDAIKGTRFLYIDISHCF